LIRGGREDFALDTVIRTTGTSKGQLFHYFPRGREELLEHATARQVERINSQLVRRYGEFDSWDVWQAWVDDTVAAHEHQRPDANCEIASLAGRAIENAPGARRTAGRAYTDFVDVLAHGLRLMHRREELRHDAELRYLLRPRQRFALCSPRTHRRLTAWLSRLAPEAAKAMAHAAGFIKTSLRASGFDAVAGKAG
jgi:AcrR family transcriptional regulator